MTDGYELDIRMNNMEALLNAQDAITEELVNISAEIDILPKIPDNIDRWLDSVPNVDKENFKLADFKKMFKMQKKYNDLLEERSNNNSKLKVIVIDNLLDKIKEVLGK